MVKTTTTIENVPSLNVQHLDNQYDVIGWKAWAETKNNNREFHVELIMREKSFSQLVRQMDLSQTVKAPKNFSERSLEI